MRNREDSIDVTNPEAKKGVMRLALEKAFGHKLKGATASAHATTTSEVTFVGPSVSDEAGCNASPGDAAPPER